MDCVVKRLRLPKLFKILLAAWGCQGHMYPGVICIKIVIQFDPSYDFE